MPPKFEPQAIAADTALAMRVLEWSRSPALYSSHKEVGRGVTDQRSDSSIFSGGNGEWEWGGEDGGVGISARHILERHLMSGLRLGNAGFVASVWAAERWDVRGKRAGKVKKIRRLWAPSGEERDD
ncbi:hypothetical protein GX48_01591 [Paracoccidioides brasiliensis]|nr:hypothetical protein GX48_01591 [Paracoccidioides brasiliensis]